MLIKRPDLAMDRCVPLARKPAVARDDILIARSFGLPLLAGIVSTSVQVPPAYPHKLVRKSRFFFDMPPCFPEVRALPYPTDGYDTIARPEADIIVCIYGILFL